MGATGRSGAAPESGLACSRAGCARQVFTTGVAPRGAWLAAVMGPGLQHGSCRSPDLSPEPGASPGSSPPHLGTTSVHAGVRVHLPATRGTCVCLRVQTSVNQSYNPVA